LGRRLATRLLERGQTVFGTTRSQRRAHELAEMGVGPLLVSVTEPVTFASLKPAVEADSVDLYYLVPPGRPGQTPSPRQIVLGGTAHLIKQMSHANLRRAILASSTAVYGQQNGETVDADTDPQPLDDRGKLLHDAEQFWLQSGAPYHVVRFAGLYGPSRIVGLRAVSEGSPLVGHPQKLLNLVHVDDAVRLLEAVMETPSPGRVELGCDGHPVPRIDYYSHLAHMLGLDPPPVMDDDEAATQFGLSADRLRRSSNKALDNIVTCRRTGWRPQYPNYKVGVETVLEEHARRQSH
jgi:nucleoside-diphosphate-sugar epimerase